MTTAKTDETHNNDWERSLATIDGEPDVLTEDERSLRKLPMKVLRVRPDYFQPRQFLDNETESDEGVKEYTRVIQSGGRLPPLLVMKIGGVWYVIDGHHRLQAYGEAAKLRKDALRKSGRRGKELTHVFVTVFEGTIQDAKDESVKRNCHDHVNMSRADKLQEAWRRVTEGTHTTKAIWRCTSISVRMIYYMRSTLKKAQRLYPEVNFAKGWKWADMARVVDGDGELPTDQEERDRQWVERKSEHFQKTFGTDLKRKPKLFCRVIRKGDAPLSVSVGHELLALERQALQEEAMARGVEEDAELRADKRPKGD